ncbi:MAG: methylated-DNA--[protein]-cysteine S-methyltransferase [Dermatophilaceae bacterium]
MPSLHVVVSPVGPLTLVSVDGETLGEIRFGAEVAQPGPVAPVLHAAAAQLAQYFAGDRRTFELPLAAVGTPFQHRVWDEVAAVPFGQTVTYGEIAAHLGMPVAAARAVGAANGANPLPIVVPCHRVIGADGTLTGYAGGLERKEALLRLEGVATERDQLELF